MRAQFLNYGEGTMAVWFCPQCGTVSLRSGTVQLELDFEDALQILVPLCQRLIAMDQAGGPKEPCPPELLHEEPEELGEDA